MRTWVKLDYRLFLNRMDARKRPNPHSIGLELHMWVKHLRGVRTSLLIREKLELIGAA